MPAGTTVATYERWDGSPAALVGMVEQSSLPEHPELGKVMRVLQTMGYFVVYNLGMIIGLLPIFPAFYVLYNLDNWIAAESDYTIPWSWVPILAWPSALVLVFVSMAVVVLARWALLPRSRSAATRFSAASISASGCFRSRHRCATRDVEFALCNRLHAQLVSPDGCKIGRGTEISANFAGRYDLIEMGENNFIGDEAIFGDEDISGGWMTLERLKTGDRCFFGNSSVVAARLGDRGRCPDRRQVAASGQPSCQGRRDVARQPGDHASDPREGRAFGQHDLRAADPDAALAYGVRGDAHLVCRRRC